MTLTTFIILSLAVWWISRILTHETGPYHIVEKFRNAIINEPWSPIYCLRCTSVWISFLLNLLLGVPFPIFILSWFGAAGVSVLIEYARDMYLEREIIGQEEKN